MSKHSVTGGALRPGALIAVAAAALLCASALAVVPQTWTTATEADFAAGQLDSTVANSRGQVLLARDVKVLMPSSAAPAVVSAVAVRGKTIYAAAGNKNVIYKIEGAKATEWAKPPGTMVTCLLTAGKDMLAGTGGKDAGLYRIDPRGKVKRVWADEKVKYVWAVAPADAGTIYVATGPEGKVFAIDKAGKAHLVYHAKDLAKNILCLVRGEEGKLYAGTDDNGLVVEIDPARKTARVLYDAAEKEIAALVLAPAGGLYAATSDTAKASPDGKVKPNGAKAGKAVGAKKPPATKPKPAAKPAPPKTAPKPKVEKPKPAKPPAKAPPKKPASPDKAKKPKKPTTKPAKDPKAEPPARPAPAKPPAEAKTVVVVPARSAKSAPPRPLAPGGPAKPAAVIRIVRPGSPPRSGARPKPPTKPTTGVGNAVYFIAPDGLVTTRFRKPVTILAMIRHKDKLILGTGNGGKVYSVSTDGDEIAPLIDTDAKQITALAVGDDGRLVFGSANKGSVGTIGPAYARKGTYTSKAVDAKQISKWGTVRVRAAVPAGSKATIATRSGNVAKPDDRTWSNWSKPQPVDGEYRPVMSPAGRFLQFRLTLSGSGKATASVSEVRVIHQAGNLAPVFVALAVQASDKDARNKPVPTRAFRHMMIRAADPNGDVLTYDIAFRAVGTRNWIEIAKKLAAPKYVWDTRTVGDGAYEVRVIASDASANPPDSQLTAGRISDPVVVDNTAPVIQKLAAKPAGKKVSVTGTAADAGTRIVRVYYAVDSQSAWTAVLPTDGICDSPRELFAFDIKDLKPGAHRIAVKAHDYYVNTRYAALTVVVK